MFDLLIKNAKICDGSGGPSYIGYVGVKDGKIVAVEQGSSPGFSASRTIDADGLVLTPGFVDPHTHYDAQIAWDPLLTCSPWHGVTTVVQGNCGVGVAPLAPHAREMALRDLEHVEDIPYDVMASAIDGKWETFGEYLDVIEKRGVGVNVAPMVPLTPMRQTVMGEESLDRAANDDELKALENLFRQSIKAGGFGWSATFSEGHLGYGGRPVACRLADAREMKTLCRVMAEEKTGTTQVSVSRPKLGDLPDEGFEMLKMISTVSGRPVTYLTLMNDPEDPNAYLQAANKLGDWLNSGRIVPQIFVKPVTLRFGLRNPTTPSGVQKQMIKALDKSYEEVTALYRDPSFRAAMQKEVDEATGLGKGFFDRVWVLDGDSDEVKGLMNNGKSISQIAKQRGVRTVDCWFDIALNDQLKTSFTFAGAAYEPEGVKNLLRDGRFLPGLGDGGAHIATLNDTGYVTHVLGHWCRDNKVMPLEEAVRMVTSFPARVFGIKGRGQILKGNHADLALIEFDKVGACAPEYVNDLPGGARRLISRATGVAATIVNGHVLFENGNHCGGLPGKMLRSYDMR